MVRGLLAFQKVLLLTGLICLGKSLIAQVPPNDICLSATHIQNIENYCSEPGQFTNVNATGVGQLETSCLISLENDVWFTFIPSAQAVLIKVNGNVNELGTLQGPGIFVFDGSCTNLNSVGCNTVSAGEGAIELTVSDLVLGRVYYIAVVGANAGTFQLCIDQFTPPPQPESDCDKAVVLCDTSPFFVEHVTGIGDPVINEVNGTCVIQELASVWYKWTCESSGSFTFTLTPNNYIPGFESDDLDFVLFELPGGLNDCNSKRVIRCMASGANTEGGMVLPLDQWDECNGPTGLRFGETDTVETGGCQGNSNNWIKEAYLEEGKSYALIINNFSASGLGFSIEFGGTATFLGPEPDFEVEAVQAFECDKTIIFTNQSTSMTDPIVEWQWNFGAGATPTFADSSGPHSVVYESFGDKVAALTVESARGCIVTKILNLYVEPCCADTSTLDLSALADDQICPGVSDGVISAFGMNGAPEYQFSLDGVNYQPSPVITRLDPGDYTVYVQDIKGCRDSTVVTVGPADPFEVDAGDTIVVELGYPAQLEAVPIPNITPTSITWIPAGGLQFGVDSLRPQVLTGVPTVYTVEITNENGCIATDDVFVLVEVVRPIFIPNVISANADGLNDYFYISAGPAADNVEILRIFDRWGALVFEDSDFMPNDELRGWDGTFNGEPVDPGVFTFYTTIHFLDDVSQTYSGTITVVR